MPPSAAERETTAETYKNKHIDSEWCAKGENCNDPGHTSSN